MQRGAGVGSGARPAKAPGVFETIAAAASTLLVRPWLLLVPLALDLWLWLGPRLSPAAVAEPIGRWLTRSEAAVPAAAAGEPGAGWFSPQDWGATGDLADLVGAFVPALLTSIDRATLPELWPRPVVVPDPGPLAALALGVIVLGVGGLMAFLTMLARVAGDEPLDRGLLRRAGAATLRYLGFLGLALVVAVALAIPAGIAFALAELLLGVPAGLSLGLTVLPAALAASVLLAFTAEAIVLTGAGPLRAPLLSARLVRRHPWPALGLLLVVQTFVFGLPLVAGPLVETLPGLLLALPAAAFVATALALAKLRFFADRTEASGVRRQA